MLKKIMNLLSLAALIVLSIITSQTYAQEQTYATLLKWEKFNEIIKTLSTGHAVSGSVDDNIIKTITRSYNEPSELINSITGSTATSDYFVKVWFDWTDTIYYYTQADKIYMNSNSEYLFRNLKALENLDLSSFDTSQVTKMKHMFLNDFKLTNLDLRSFDTRNVTNMYWMFNWCQALTTLNVSSFDTRNVTNMQTMFYDLKSIETLDLRSFDTSSVTNMKSMFANNKKDSTNLTTIYVSDKFITNNVTTEENGSNMFTYDTKLIWWNWTQFNESNNNVKYARIDTEWQSWYFTDVNNITVKFININDDSIYTQTVNKWEIADISNIIKTWYNTSFYEDSGASVWFDVEQPIEKYTEIYFSQSINKYTITFDTDWWNNIEAITEDYGTPIIVPDDPVKDGYKFVWWDKEIPSTMPAENITIKAKREKINSSWGNWWYSWWGNWWGNWWNKWGKTNEGDSIDKSINKNNWSWDELQNITWENKELNNSTCIEKWYSQEMCNTYNWAYDNWLTKYDNITDARFNSQTNRQEMAKISSIFASKLFWKTPDTNKQDVCSKFTDLNKLNNEMKSYIIQICELWYMWYKANGIDTLEKFRPYTPITLAEMSTTLSRIVWWNKYASNGGKWYQWHLYATYENNLINDISNPYRTVTRWEMYNTLYKLYKSKHN